MAALEDRFEASGVSIFAMANLQKIEIMVGLTVFFRDVKAVMAREKELVDGAETKRTLLLTRQSPVARNRRVAASHSQPQRFSERIRAHREKAEASTE